MEVAVIGEVEPKSIEPIAYNIPAAVHVSGCTRTAVYDAIRRRDLKSLKIGRRRLILRDDLVDWLRGHAA